jgi:hypothetical protein
MPDVSMTLTIPEGKVSYAKAGFLSLFPKPEEGEFSGTDMEWVEFAIKQQLTRLVHKGHRKLEQEGVLFDEGVII